MESLTDKTPESLQVWEVSLISHGTLREL